MKNVKKIPIPMTTNTRQDNNPKRKEVVIKMY